MVEMYLISIQAAQVNTLLTLVVKHLGSPAAGRCKRQVVGWLNFLEGEAIQMSPDWSGRS